MSVEWRTIGFPSHLCKIESSSFMLGNIQMTSGSQISQFVRATGLIAQRWQGDINLSTMLREKWQEWEAFIASLSGQAVLFEMPSPTQSVPVGIGGGFRTSNPAYSISGVTISGVSLLTGATTGRVEQDQSRYSQSILIDFGIDQAGQKVLKPGDRFGIGGNLYMATGPAVADEDGIARVAFRWRLHKAAREGDIVNFKRPTFRAALKSGGEGIVNVSVPNLGKSGLSCVEIPYVN